MYFSRTTAKLHKALEAIEAIKDQVQEMKADLDLFKGDVERDMENIKQDFSTLIRAIEEDAEGAGGETFAENGQPKDQEENDVEKIKSDLAYLKQCVTDILEWTNTVKPEFKTLNERINEARKDIKNKISYAVSRLKT